MAGERAKEKELVELFEAAKKAAEVARSQVDGGADESRCLDALHQLKSFPVTLDSLVNTKVPIFLFFPFCNIIIIIIIPLVLNICHSLITTVFSLL